MGTGKAGRTTKPANNSHGRSIKNPSDTFHQAFSTCKSIPIRHAANTIPIPSTNKPPANR